MNLALRDMCGDQEHGDDRRKSVARSTDMTRHDTITLGMTETVTSTTEANEVMWAAATRIDIPPNGVGASPHDEVARRMK